MWIRDDTRWRPVFAAEGGDGGGDGGGGGTETPWTEGFSDEQMDTVNRLGWKSAADAVGAYAGAETKLGAPASELIRLPGKNATDDDYRALHTKLGAPDKPDGYSFPARDNPRGELDTAVRDEAHALGLTPRQAIALRDRQYARFDKINAEVDARVQGNVDKVDAALKVKHADKFDEVKAVMDRGLDYLAGDDQALHDALMDAGLTGNQAAAERLIAIGRSISEDGKLLGGSGRGFGDDLDTPEGAQAEIKRLEADKDFMNKLNDRRHPDHDEAVRQRSELYQKAYASSPKAA